MGTEKLAVSERGYFPAKFAANAPYFGAVLDERTLVPGADATVFETTSRNGWRRTLREATAELAASA